MTMEPPANNLGAIWASLTQSQREKVLQMCAEEGRERFDTYRDILRENIGLRRPSPDVRLQMYMQRDQLRWAQIWAFQPDMYVDDTKDFQHLAERFDDDEPEPTSSIRPAASMYG